MRVVAAKLLHPADYQGQFVRKVRLCGAVAALALALSGCAGLGAGGPTSRAVNHADGAPVAAAQIKIIDLTDAAARRSIAASVGRTFAEGLGDGMPYGAVISRGDSLDIQIWEAPPAALFGASLADQRYGGSSTARGTGFPEQMVGNDGAVQVPFAGKIPAAGRSTNQIEAEIVSRLTGKAHQPQAIVRISRNAAAVVTVVGDINNNTRVPLTTRGERLLDVIASVGGLRQPISKTMIQINRGDRSVSMPMEAVIRDPAQNIRMQADDIVTAQFQPYSFIVLGATNHNAEVPFESVGITLAQALGRSGGLQDNRADAKGVFIFRLENPDALDPDNMVGAKTTPDGKIPVIYRVDLTNPASFFVAQGFPIRNKDVLYISNAPIADIQKFVNIISTMAFSVAGVASTVP